MIHELFVGLLVHTYFACYTAAIVTYRRNSEERADQLQIALQVSHDNIARIFNVQEKCLLRPLLPGTSDESIHRQVLLDITLEPNNQSNHTTARQQNNADRMPTRTDSLPSRYSMAGGSGSNELDSRSSSSSDGSKVAKYDSTHTGCQSSVCTGCSLSRNTAHLFP